MASVDTGSARPAYAVLADELRRRIVEGDLGPGDRLPAEVELTEAFGVGRSTVREALRVLASEDLVRTTRGVTGGTFVAAPDGGRVSSYLELHVGLMAGASAVSVDSLLEAREALEVPAARLAARRRTPDSLQAFRGWLADPDDLDREQRFELNRGFHVAVLAAAANPLIETLTQPLFTVLRERFLRDRAPATFWTSVHDDHVEIAQAIERGDEDEAAIAMRSHLHRLASTYERLERGAEVAT